MNLIFLSNYYNHHQEPLCRALAAQPGVRFRFLAYGEISPERRKMWGEMREPPDFVRVPRTQEERACAAREILQADAILVGSAPQSLLDDRLRAGRLILRYQERPLKNGTEPMKFLPRMLKWRRWNPPGKPVYLLCASAYAAGDYAKMGLFRGKAYKWGYFPQTLSYDRESLLSQKEPGSILWAGRFLDWKHPDDAIRLAARLRDAGHAFTLRMAGSGPLEPKLHQLIAQNGLDAQVRLLGSLSPEQVRREMERSAIFLFTSDRYEGWGAVLNEAMNSGCAVVASDAAGSTPYLVNDGVNGCVYPSGNGDELYGNAARLLAHPSERERMGKNAYETITDTWNAQAAAGRLCELIWAILAGDLSPEPYLEGPCSHA
jgi:glycosyltransferase involved in cell wall biosynthesis